MLIGIIGIQVFSSCTSVHNAFYDMEIDSGGGVGVEPKTVRIVHISDFHSGDFGKNEEKLLAKIRSAAPDLIMLTGDIFDFEMKGAKPVQNVRNLLSGIKDIAPFFYVTGNHEYFAYHEDEWSHIIEEYGGTVMKNEVFTAKIVQGKVIIAGVSDPFEDMTIEQRKKAKDQKELYLQRLEQTARLTDEACEKDPDYLFTVLMAHRPEYIEEYRKYNYDLILSGHAHGGQWRFPPFINGLYAPMQGLFPKWAGGRYDVASPNGSDSRVFIVSRGLSYQHPRIPRIFNNPELVIIDITVAPKTVSNAEL